MFVHHDTHRLSDVTNLLVFFPQGLAPAVEEDVLTSDVLLLFNQLAGDDQDSVRLLAIENCTALSGVLSEDNNQVHIMPLVTTCAKDKSWRVRYMVADKFTELQKAVGPEITKTDLVPAFQVSYTRSYDLISLYAIAIK